MPDAPIPRRTLRWAAALLAAGLITACGSAADAGQGQEAGLEDELVVAAVGGDLGATYKTILERFGEETGVRVTYVEQDVPTSLTKLSAQVPAGQVQYDVVMLNDVAGAQAKARGLTEPVDRTRIPNLADALPAATSPTVDGPFTAFSVLGMAYSPSQFAERGWDPPTTWADFVDTRYGSCVAPPDPVKAGSGVVALALINRAVGSGYADVDTTLTALRPSADTIPSVTGNLSQTLQLMSQGSVCLGVGTQGVALQAAAGGADVAFAVPVGTSSQGLPLVVPRGAAHPNAAHAFIDYVFRPESQLLILEDALWTPARGGITGTTPISQQVVTPEEFDDYQVEPIPVEVFDNTSEWGRKFGDLFGR